MLQFCVQVAEAQLEKGKGFLIEQPHRASSWNTRSVQWLASQERVLHLFFDQCLLGLRVAAATGELSRKRTGFLTSPNEMAQHQCEGRHYHATLEGGLPHLAQVWPHDLIMAVINGIQQQLEWCGVADVGSRSDEESEEEQDTRLSGVEAEKEITAQQKEMIRRLRHNMGHLPTDRMVIMLKAAKAQPQVIRYVRDKFNCETCVRQRRQVQRRHAAFPRTFEFSQIVGADAFFIEWEGRGIPFLNLVDHGTNGALLHLLKSGMLKIDKEEAELLRRKTTDGARSRSRRSSERLLESEDAEYYLTIISNLIWG